MSWVISLSVTAQYEYTPFFIYVVVTGLAIGSTMQDQIPVGAQQTMHKCRIVVQHRLAIPCCCPLAEKVLLKRSMFLDLRSTTNHFRHHLHTNCPGRIICCRFLSISPEQSFHYRACRPEIPDPSIAPPDVPYDLDRTVLSTP